MKKKPIFNFLNLFQLGFLAPINSAKFMKKNKWLMFMSLAPHILGLFAYMWTINAVVVPKLHLAFQSFENSPMIRLLRASGTLSIYLLAILLFSLFGLPIISKISSPIQDFICARSYEKTSGRVLPNLSVTDNIRLLLSEFTKVIVFLIFTLFIFIFPILSPFLFVFSIWFLGWDHLDRCWSLKGLHLQERLTLGFTNFPACFGLGLWSYVPFAGSVFGFVMTAAGGYIVGQLDKSLFSKNDVQ